jgi:lactate dehydrogenase-like 2-hydroxyacid dehydrogenase
MKIVFLDVKTIGEDIDLSAYDELGEVVKYSFSSPEEVPARVTDADVIILNKVPVNEQTIGTAKNLKLVCVTATGTNNLDKEYLDSKEMLPVILLRLSHSTHLQCFSSY